MIEHFQVDEPLFEDQIHERQQFSLSFKGEEHQGVFEKGDISWFQPSPHNTIDEAHIEAVEAEVRTLMQQYLQ